MDLWSATLRWRHLPPIESEAKGLPGNSDRDTGNSDRDTGNYSLFDFSSRYAISNNISMRFGVDNLLDRQPERTFRNDTNTAAGETNRNFYDILGRRYYLGVNMKF